MTMTEFWIAHFKYISIQVGDNAMVVGLFDTCEMGMSEIEKFLESKVQWSDPSAYGHAYSYVPVEFTKQGHPSATAIYMSVSRFYLNETLKERFARHEREYADYRQKKFEGEQLARQASQTINSIDADNERQSLGR
jgi:hypothetical protein